MTIPPAPEGNGEIIKKAIVRAKQALLESPSEYAVGFAEGVIIEKNKIFTSVWCAIVTSDSRIFLGGGLNVELSEPLKRKKLNNKLVESDIEGYLNSLSGSSYELLVVSALQKYKEQGP